MAITFDCEGCGKAYTVRDELAGKTGQCKQCGQRMTIPTEADSDGYGLEGHDREPEPAPEPGSAPIPPRRFKPISESAAPRRPLYESPGASTPKKSFFGAGQNGTVGVLIAVALIGLRVYFRWDRGQNRNARNPQANAQGPLNVRPNFMLPPMPMPPPMPIANRSGPIRLPKFPEPGPAREIEPGIVVREVRLGADRPPMNAPPGLGGKLWLYLPSGQHPDHSLPCILIAGAGSKLIDGMDLGDGDRPEHLPYVRAGFAVLAFEIDGVLRNRENPTEAETRQSMTRFLNARAGLVNAHIALEYALKKVPAIDPSKISAAGHSSAGTLAVLFAEHEPRLKACVAFAPTLDLEKRFGPQAIASLNRAGAGDLAVRYSPKNNVDKLQVPLFLFHARDDSNVPVETSEAFAASLEAKGKPVTLDLVPTGDHSDSMINEGIPHAIAWLKEQGAGPGR